MITGSGRCEMLFPDDFFPNPEFVTKTHAIYARALVFGSYRPFVLVSVEMTSLPEDEIEALKKLAASSAETRPERVWITVTHTFSAPHIPPADGLKEEDKARRKALQTVLRDAVHTAVLQAKRNVCETAVEFRSGQSQIPVNRDVCLPEGWWIGAGGTGPSDRTLSVLQFNHGKSNTFLVHLNVQSSILDGTGAKNGKTVSGDLAGIACRHLEKRFVYTNFIFLIGAAGDQAPCEKARDLARKEDGTWSEFDLHEEGVDLAVRLGRQLGDEIDALLHTPALLSGIEAEPELCEFTLDVPAKKMNMDRLALRPCHSCPWEADGRRTEPVSLLRLGNIAFAGVRPELCYATDQWIKTHSPFAHTLVCTLVNGAAKYMADRDSYDRFTYEAINSPFAPGAAETLAASVVEHLNTLSPETA